MADLKISQLTGATTPLAGTETLPVVQSGSTKQVSVANLTAGRAVSAASLALTTSPLPTTSGGTALTSFTNKGVLYASSTSALSTNANFQFDGSQLGIGFSGTLFYTLQINGTAYFANSAAIGGANPGYLQLQYIPSGTTSDWLIKSGTGGLNILEFYDNVGGARRASLSGGGDFTLSTGNLIQGTAAKGINFTANTPAVGMTSELLNWYEEGAWTPTDASGAALTFTSAAGSYTRVGRLVNWQAVIVYPSTANASDSLIGGLPFTVAGGSGSQGRAGAFVSLTDVATLVHIMQVDSSTTLRPYKAGFVRATNADLSSSNIYIGGFFVV
jgi:hypothetical protein